MSDDLVKRLGFHGFNGTENALHRTRRWTVERLEAKDRIEELEAERDNWRKVAIDSLAMKEGSDTRAEAAEQRIEELEDKLAKFMV